MAVDKIEKTTPEFFQLTPTASFSGSGGFGIYYPNSRTVFIFGFANNNADMGNTALATVPTKYRPSSTKTNVLCGKVTVGENVLNVATNLISVNTNGTITQTLSSYMRAVLFFGMYTI